MRFRRKTRIDEVHEEYKDRCGSGGIQGYMRFRRNTRIDEVQEEYKDR